MEKKVGTKHRKDHRVLCRDIISTGILVFGLLGIAIPLINHEVSAQVLTVVRGGELTCPFGSAEIPHNNEPADALAILGAGLRLTDYGSWVPTKYEEERLATGAGLFVVGYLKPEVEVVLLDGRQPKGAGRKVDKNVFKQKVKELSEGTASIAEEKIIVENNSVNTPTGMDELKKLAEEHNWKNIIAVTHANHVERAQLDAYLRGLCNVTFISVEDYTSLFKPKNSESLRERNNSLQGKVRRFKEQMGFLFHMYDPYWKLRTIYKEAVHK